MANSSSSHTQSEHGPGCLLQVKKERPHQNILASPLFPVTVLVNLHSLHHALCLVKIQLIVPAFHNMFFRRVILVQVTQTLSTDVPTAALLAVSISGFPQKTVSGKET